MDSKEAIIKATMDLISATRDHVEAITMRDIGKTSGVQKFGCIGENDRAGTDNYIQGAVG